MNQKGFTMMEVVLTIGLATMLMSSIVSFVLIANKSSDHSLQRENALWVAQEGIAALESISFSDLFLTQTGALTFASSQWTLNALGPEILDGNISRTVSIEEVRRDENCLIVAFPAGSVDEDSYAIQSEVLWIDSSGNNQNIKLRSLKTNWQNSEGDCFADTDADGITLNTSSAHWSGGQQLRDVYLTNNSSSSVEIKKITFWWNNSSRVYQIFIGGNKFWSNVGPGTPSGDQASGTELTGSPEEIEGQETEEMPKIQFRNNMTGSTISFKLEFSDGSSVTSEPFIPSF